MKVICVLILGCWLAPAVWAMDLTSDWIAERHGPSGEKRTLTLHLRADGSTLTGTVSGLGGNTGDAEISEGSMNGDQVSFSLVRGPFKMKYQGKITGNTIHFQLMREQGESSSNTTNQTEEWDAHRTGS